MYAKHLVVAAVAALCGYGIFQLTAVSAQEPQKPTNSEQEIRAAAAAYAAAFSKGDIDTVLTFWTDDADYMDDDGVVHRGKPAIVKLFKETGEHIKGHTMSLEVQLVKFPRPDVAIEEGVVTINHPGSGSDSNRYISLWVKNGDRWQLSSARDQATESLAEADSDDEPLKEFAWLLGDWANETTGVKCALTCKWALNKRFLEMDYDTKKDNDEPSKVAVMLGFDPGANELRSWFFDSDGGNGVSRWERDGNTWTSQSRGVLSDGQTGTSENSIQYVDDDTFIWRSKNRRTDGNPVPDSEVKFTRCKDHSNDKDHSKEADKEVKQ